MIASQVESRIRFRLAPWQAAAIYSPVTHLAMLAGVGAGKTYTGAHFSIQMMLQHPELTGFIGANTYDQLSQTSLRELFYWLDHYGIEWVIDCIPPGEWGYHRKRFKSYKNILSVRHPITRHVVHVFTRVLADGDALRGLEFSWYWIDETRDTPLNTHDVILSRLRESENIRGLVTSTTNGNDWAWDRFVRRGDGKLYGSMHVPTLAAVQAGILTRAYYDTLLRSYSPILAEQELFAKHVNVRAGRAYYSASDMNRRSRAPWGDVYPDVSRPLVVGCDFNFSPAPCIWIVGQLGPCLLDGHTKQPKDYTQHIHWFRELVGVESSTRSMAKMLMGQFPGYHYQVFGDASGGVGTTSNAGEHDYHQMADEFSLAGVSYSLDYDQRNPLVRDRVENMNAKYRNAAGGYQMTYDPAGCVNLDQDNRTVGWKPTTQRGRGKLDDGGDNQRTHASDAAGYAVWKLLPPGKRGIFVDPVQSQATQILAEAG